MLSFKSLRQALLMGVATLGTTAAIGAIEQPAFAQEVTRTYNIQPQDLNSALREFALQTGRDVLYPPELVAGKRSPGAQGQLTERQALESILAGTGLRFEQTVSNGYAVQSNDSPTQLGAADETPSTEEEIVVVGTRIRGSAPVGSPTYSLDRSDIENSAVLSTEQILQNIPQNTGDLASAQVALISASNANQQNLGLGTGANLRGLGAQSTLTLVNGRRIAPSGSGNFTDTSIIPLSAIDRVEILLDGASAIYGSDAVGGAVNFVLRRDFTGVELGYRHGWTEDGGGEEDRATLTAGATLGSFSGLLAYEYLDQASILASQRGAGAIQPAPLTLVPEQRRHNLFARGSLALADNVEFTLTGLFSDRTAEVLLFDLFSGDPISNERRSRSYAVSGDLEWGMGDNWTIDVFGSLSRVDNDSDLDFSGFVFSTDEVAETAVGEASATGPIFAMPGGAVQAAFGVGSQYSRLESELGGGDPGSRTNHYGFFELSVPVIAPYNQVAFVHRLTLSLAERFEEYSDFGWADNPKVGVAWELTPAFALRGSYGTSLRAPSLFDVDEAGTQSNLIFDLPDSSGSTRSVIAFGGNDDLEPEEAETWTLGAEWKVIPSLSLSAGYYNISYQDRIAAVGGSIFSALTDTAVAPTVIRRASMTDAQFNALVLEQLQRTPIFGCADPLDANGACTEDPSNFDAIVDRRTLNLGSLETSGFDINVDYGFDTAWGDVALRLALTHIDKYTVQVTPDAPNSDRRNTFESPLTLTLNGGASLTRDDWTLAVNVSYDNSYHVANAPGSPEIDAWTTVDLYSSYLFDGIDNDGRGLRASLSIRNLFNEEPPSVPNVLNSFGVTYDSANASVIGRQFAVELRQSW